MPSSTKEAEVRGRNPVAESDSSEEQHEPKEPELSAEEKQQLLEAAIERSEKLAESQLEMAHYFLEHGKVDVAHRRLKEIVEKFPASSAADDARRLLDSLAITSP